MDAGSQVPLWLSGTSVSPSAFQEMIWKQSAGSSAQDILKPWWHWQCPEHWGLLCSGKINSHLAPYPWPFLQRAQTPSEPAITAFTCSGDGKWLMFGHLCFQCLFWVEDFFPPYSKCNKQKYCLKSIIEHMSSILFTNILFVLFSPPLI